MTSRHLRAIVIAVIALFIVAGTAFAAHPASLPILGDPGASSAAHSPAANHSAEPEKSARPKAQTSPKAETEAEGAGALPAAAEIDRVVANLKDAGIIVTPAAVADMAGKVGLGGAVRVFLFAHESGKTPAEILAMFQGGKGWGQIAKDLNLESGPGIGGIMGNGQGKGHDKGQGKAHASHGTDD